MHIGRTKFQLMTLKEVLFLENFFFQMNPAGRYSLYPFKTKTSSINFDQEKTMTFNHDRQFLHIQFLSKKNCLYPRTELKNPTTHFKINTHVRFYNLKTYLHLYEEAM